MEKGLKGFWISIWGKIADHEKLGNYPLTSSIRMNLGILSPEVY
jgi:hypothetical protein